MTWTPCSRRSSTAGFSTRRIQSQILDSVNYQYLFDSLPLPSARSVTVSRYLRTRWLPTHEARLRPRTSFRYEQMIDRKVLPHIGRVPVRSLTITHLEDLSAHLPRSPPRRTT